MVDPSQRARVAKVYIPRTCLQGEDLPAHVLWKSDEVTKIRIRVPPELQVKEVYNVPAGSIETLTERRVELSEFKVPGFLGLVFGTRHVESGKLRVEVDLELFDAQGRPIQEDTREILLFRPLLKTEEVPRKVFGIASDTHGFSRLDPLLGLSNVGDGTAVVFVQVVNSPTARISHPEEVGEFVKRYRRDLITGLKEVSKDFPKYSSLVSPYISIVEREAPPTQVVKRQLLALERRFTRAFGASEDFLEAFVGAVSRAFFRNIEVVTELHSFLDYLNSVGEGRVILMNALDNLHFEKGSNLIRLRLHITDFQWGEYPAIDLDPFILNVESPGTVPVYALFTWLTPTTGRGSSG